MLTIEEVTKLLLEAELATPEEKEELLRTTDSPLLKEFIIGNYKLVKYERFD